VFECAWHIIDVQDGARPNCIREHVCGARLEEPNQVELVELAENTLHSFLTNTAPVRVIALRVEGPSKLFHQALIWVLRHLKNVGDFDLQCWLPGLDTFRVLVPEKHHLYGTQLLQGPQHIQAPEVNPGNALIRPEGGNVKNPRTVCRPIHAGPAIRITLESFARTRDSTAPQAKPSPPASTQAPPAVSILGEVSCS